MTKAEVGDFSNFSSWLPILLVIFTFDLYTSVAVARFDFKDDLDDYIASNLLLGTMLSVIFSGILLIFRKFFMNFIGISDMEIWIIIAYCLVYPATQMIQVKHRITYKYKFVVFISLISSVVPTLIALVCVYIFRRYSLALQARLLGFYVPVVFINLIIYAYLMWGKKKIRVSYWKYALMISAPLVIHVLSNNLLNSCDKIMIKRICGNTDLGSYSVAYSCAFAVSILWASINTAWSPWAFEQMDEEKYHLLRKGSVYILIGFGVLVALIMLLGPEVLWVVGDKPYQDAVGVIPPVMAGYAVQAIYTFYVNIETFSKKQKSIAVSTLIAAIINVVLNWIFIRKFGYIAAAYTTLVGYLALFIMHFLVVKRMKKEKWYNTGFNLLFIAFFVAFMFVCLVLYKFNIVRIILISCLVLVIIVFAIKERELIKQILKSKSLKPLKERLTGLVK
jgi:O-antigen/teichoic acid export membrane protein